jgi:Caudovirus prohead serine protease
MKTNNNALLTRYLGVVATVKNNVDFEQRTIENIPFSSSAPVLRYAWGFGDDEMAEGASWIFDEVLSHDPSHWRTERVTNMVCPFLLEHYGKKLGLITSVKFENECGFFSAKLRRSEDADQLFKDLEDGIAGGVSFGYRVHKYRVLEAAEWEGEGYNRKMKKRAKMEGIDIELFEISSVTMPADPNVGFSKSEEKICLRDISIEGDPNFLREKVKIENLKTIRNMPEESSLEKSLLLSQEEVKSLREEISKFNLDMTKLKSELDETTQNLSKSNADLIALKAENIQLKANKDITARYSKLRSLGEKLLSEAKISAVEFNDVFKDSSEEQIEMLLKSDDALGDLKSWEFWLNRCQSRTPLLNTEHKTSAMQQPQPKVNVESRSGFSEDSLQDDIRIRAKCKEMGLDPNNTQQYAEAMLACGITY